MADTQPVPTDNKLADPLNLNIGKMPKYFQQELAADRAANQAKLEAEDLTKTANLTEKKKVLEADAGAAKEKYAQVESEMKPEPRFNPTQDTGMDLGGLFSMIATMGVALGGSGKLSAINSLNAMGGMLKGWQSGRKDLFEREQKTFDKEMASIKYHNENLVNELKRWNELRVSNKEAALAEGELLATKYPGVLASKIRAGDTAALADISKRLSDMNVKITEASIKHGLSKGGKNYLEDYFPGIQFTGTPSQNEEKRNAINTGALSLATAEELKKYAKEHPDQLGRHGQVAQNVDRYIKSLKSGESLDGIDDGGQPALIFAKRYAAYLVGYERTLAGSNRGMTVQFQNRFNNLMGQNQFNAQGFEQLMNEQMNEVARAVSAKDPAIKGQSLLNYGHDIYRNAELDFGKENKPKSEEKAKAPQSAIDHLKANPELKEQFKAKYGYLPEGV